MPYSDVSVSLTDGQVKKLKSKSAKECGTTITLKPSQMTGGAHKISLTDRQIKHFNDALKKRRGVQIDFSKAAIANMIKSGGIFPLFAAIPGLIAAAAPAVAKAVALGAAGALGTKAVQSIAQSYEPKKGRGYKKRKGSKTTRNPVFMVQGKRIKNTRNPVSMVQGKRLQNTRNPVSMVQGNARKSLLVEIPIVPMSNFDLIDAASALALKKTLEAFS